MSAVIEPAPRATDIIACRLIIGGRVQGVGFRPFVYRAAHRHQITGHVRNRRGVVEIVAQGDAERIAAFIEHLLHDAPPLAAPQLTQREPLAWLDTDRFCIEASVDDDGTAVYVPPDQFVCDDCLAELRDPADRRYRYPFINCTQCGPRYSLIETLPYDRVNTSLRPFALCAACATEYHNPLDRRFHAEPLACPHCGPRLYFRSVETRIDGNEPALSAAVAALQTGAIVAVKGIGGYHLMCDATSDTAVARLRARKHRPDKPFAVMFPLRGADGLDAVRSAALVDKRDSAMLLHPARPVVLITKRHDSALSSRIAPRLTEIGAMLPYSPLHHLLLDDFDGPLVATSANISGEPVLTDPRKVEERLAGIADAFLHHDRAIVRPADDAVFRMIQAAPRPLRLGRGVAPLELELATALPQPVLAVGGHMKNTVALAWDRRVVISPHIGDLTALRSQHVFERVINDLQQLYGIEPQIIVCDAHPGYVSTRWARRSGKQTIQVLHHHAHASAVAGEFTHEPRWLIFTWDGTGYGDDGTLWGGEALLGAPGGWRRVASMRRFPVPGGDRASEEPWRVAAALCWETGTRWVDEPQDSATLRSAYERGINSPLTSAVGRLFDAAAALTGLAYYNSYNAQAPMRLEAAADDNASPLFLETTLGDDDVILTDWAPLVPMLLDTQRSVSVRAACFHVTLAAALVNQATMLRETHGDFAVGLSGGVFQNRLLTERVITELTKLGFRVYFPGRVPVNDGGLCWGQIVEAAGLTFNV